MQFTLTIQGDSLADLKEVLAIQEALAPTVVANQAPNVEVEPETPKKSTRSRGKTDAAKQDTAPPATPQESSAGPTAPTDVSPSEETPTLSDVRSRASELMDSGKVDSKAITDMLVEKFGARAFSQVPAEKFADLIGEMNNLA